MKYINIISITLLINKSYQQEITLALKLNSIYTALCSVSKQRSRHLGILRRCFSEIILLATEDADFELSEFLRICWWLCAYLLNIVSSMCMWTTKRGSWNPRYWSDFRCIVRKPEILKIHQISFTGNNTTITKSTHHPHALNKWNVHFALPQENIH